jgi:hypothetical protein
MARAASATGGSARISSATAQARAASRKRRGPAVAHRAGEGEERAEVAGRAGGRHEDAHGRFDVTPGFAFRARAGRAHVSDVVETWGGRRGNRLPRSVDFRCSHESSLSRSAR